MNSRYGGSWSLRTGTYYYHSSEEAYDAGCRYQDQHGSWSHTEYKNQYTTRKVFEFLNAHHYEAGLIKEIFFNQYWVEYRRSTAEFYNPGTMDVVDIMKLFTQEFEEDSETGGDEDPTAFRFANAINEYNPITNLWDVVAYAFTGKDRFGNSMNQFQGMMKAAGVLPVGKFGGLVGKASGTKLFNFNSTAAEHMANPNRAVPMQILEQALMSLKGIPEPRGSRALLYTSEMWKNGEMYNLEILYYQVTNSIWYFKYFIP